MNIKIVSYLIVSVFISLYDACSSVLHSGKRHFELNDHVMHVSIFPILCDGKGVEYDYDRHGNLGHVYWVNGDKKKVLR